MNTVSYEAPFVNLWAGFWTVEVAPSPKFHAHEVGFPVEVSVNRTLPLEPDSAQLKFATSGVGIGVVVTTVVAVAVGFGVDGAVAVVVTVVVTTVVAVVVVVTVAVGMTVTVAVGVAMVRVVEVTVVAPPIKSSFAMITPDVTSRKRTATGPAGRDAGVTPVSVFVRVNPDPV